MVYDQVNAMYNDNLTVGHVIVHKFYKENFPDLVSPCGNFTLAVLAIDGSYDKRGYHASHGITFAFEVYTGIGLDKNATEKCFKCQNCDKFQTICPFNLFHGSSGQMEGENAFHIFSRSEGFGFQYIKYVSDGDAKVFPRIQYIYGD